jgi:peptidoglycan/LPS O-acetylase OafA/YrhL
VLLEAELIGVAMAIRERSSRPASQRSCQGSLWGFQDGPRQVTVGAGRVMAASNQFNASIHGLRGFASIGVVFHHIWAGSVADHFSPFPAEIQFSGLFLQYGVEIFFMISGFLITRSIIKHGSARAFWLDRVLRLYPAYIPILLLLFVVGPLVNYEYFRGITGSDWILLLISNALFLPGVVPVEAALAVAWTLSFEAVFYLFAGIVYVLYGRLPRRTATILVLTLTFALFFLFPKIAPFFAIGVVLYFGELRLRQCRKPLGAAAPLALTLFFASMLIYMGDPYGLLHLAGTGNPVIFLAALVCALIAFASVVAQSGALAWLMRTAAFQWLGTVSYSLYLWHTPIMFVTKRASISAFESNWLALTAFALTSLLIAIPISWLSYVMFEGALSDWIRWGFQGGVRRVTLLKPEVPS